jgi:predicted aminopeptidase
MSGTNVEIYFSIRDRIRTTNNMLGDCYCAAVVEHLSRKELMACDAINFYQDITPGQVSNVAQRNSVPELIVVSLNENEASRKTEKQKQ